MAIENVNSILIEDDEGIIVITDISENKDMVYGEFVYDGKNIGIFNRDNEKYYAIQNIPPSMRENLLKSEFLKPTKTRLNLCICFTCILDLTQALPKSLY